MRPKAQTSSRIAALVVICVAGIASAAGPLHRVSLENHDCDEEVPRTALIEIRQKNYEQGRLLLKKLVGRKCPLMPAASLLIADTYYREGGSSALATATGEYARWLDQFPEQELAPFVMKKMAEAHLRQLNGRNGYDQLALANRALLKLQSLFPEFGDDPNVREYVMVTQELRAEHELKVAQFYIDTRESPEAGKMRCLEILEKYPRFTRMDIALWYLAKADEALALTEDPDDNIKEAIASYERIARQHADSEYRDRAIEKLKYFGHNVPDPDPEITPELRERASKARNELADISGFVAAISRRGVLLSEDDEVESDGLNRLLK